MENLENGNDGYVMVGAFMDDLDRENISRISKESKAYAPSTLTGRRPAAHVLALVAAAGESGNVDELITPEMVGHAVSRLVSNYTEDDSWLRRFLVGLSAR
jgi:hypothetical protein